MNGCPFLHSLRRAGGGLRRRPRDYTTYSTYERRISLAVICNYGNMRGGPSWAAKKTALPNYGVSMKITNTIFYLFGFRGIGKLTISLEIQKIIPAILVDNQFINNVVFGLIDPDGISPLPEQVWRNTRRVRKVVLDTIRDLSRPERNFIFTNELIEGSLPDQEVFGKIASMAIHREAFFFPIRLLISPEEQCRRVVSPERKAKFKNTDAVSALAQTQKYEVMRPLVPYFELNISALSAAESAMEIVRALEQRYRF